MCLDLRDFFSMPGYGPTLSRIEMSLEILPVFQDCLDRESNSDRRWLLQRYLRNESWETHCLVAGFLR